jgi:hypothetical protein
MTAPSNSATDRVAATRNNILWVLRDALSPGTNVSFGELCGRIDAVVGDAQREHEQDIRRELRPWDE